MPLDMPTELPPEMAAMADKIDARREDMTPPPPMIPFKELGLMWPSLVKLAKSFGTPLEGEAPKGSYESPEMKSLPFPPDAWKVVVATQVALSELGDDRTLSLPTGPEMDETDAKVLMGELAALAEDRDFLRALNKRELPELPKEEDTEEEEPETEAPEMMEEGEDEMTSLFASRMK